MNNKITYHKVGDYHLPNLYLTKDEYEKDYQIPKLLGMNIEEIKEPEEIDNKIEELKKQKYTTIVIPNELASFSQDIISKYKYDPTLNIIIIPSKDN